MTVRDLEPLTEEERELVLLTPALVSVLIGGADGDFDDIEERRARKSVHYKSIQGDNILLDYYKAVNISFSTSLDHIEQKYEGNAEKMTKSISEKLTTLNDILPKLDARFVTALLDDWRGLAKSVAKASGGILGFASIGYKESHYIDLEMITFQP